MRRPPKRSLAPLIGAILLASLSAAVAPAAAQPWGPRAQESAGVRFEVLEPFGYETTPGAEWFSLRVRMQNTTGASRRGRVQVGHRQTMWGGEALRQDAVIELPPHSTRELVVPYLLEAGYGGDNPDLEFSPEGGQPLLWRVQSTLQGSTLLIIELPPLRRAIEEMINTGMLRLQYASLETAGGAGDLALPESALDMRYIRTIAVPVRVLDRASPAQLAMLADWVSFGAHLVLYARDEADLRRPWVVDWIGEVEVLPEPADVEPAPDVERDENGEPIAARAAPQTPTMRLACGSRQERGGCSRPLGNGRVFLAGYDPSTWTEPDEARVHDLALCHAAREGNRAVPAPGYMAGQVASLMRVLDPNTGFTPALGLVALVLLVYLIFVGPLNFRFVQKRNRPMLALATTPALALGCLLVLFAVGFLGKGVQSRYRSFEVISLSEGHPRALSRRYLGLYTTSPQTYDLRFARDTRARWLTRSPGRQPVRRMRGDEHVLEGITSGLWETRFFDEERVVEVGAVHVEWSGTSPSAVENATGSPIEGALLVHNTAVYALGDLAPGARVELPSAPTTHVAANRWEVDSYAVARLRAHFGLLPADDPLLHTLSQMLGGQFIEEDCAVVYGRLPASDERFAGRFAPDTQTRFLRAVSPSPALEALPSAPPSGYDPTLEGYEPAEAFERAIEGTLDENGELPQDAEPVQSVELGPGEPDDSEAADAEGSP